jgi:hypothetical protein
MSGLGVSSGNHFEARILSTIYEKIIGSESYPPENEKTGEPDQF